MRSVGISPTPNWKFLTLLWGARGVCMDKKQLVCAPPDPSSLHQLFAPCTPRKAMRYSGCQEIDRLSRFIYVHSADTRRERVWVWSTSCDGSAMDNWI